MKKTTTKKTTRVSKVGIIKPFADGEMTNSVFFGMIRSALRNKSRFFPSVKICRERAKVPYNGPNRRQKWLYRCEICGQLRDSKITNVHHKIECGSLTSFEDLAGFTQRLFCSSEDLILICNDCHDKIHNKNQ